jgi:hypothetical protein
VAEGNSIRKGNFLKSKQKRNCFEPYRQFSCNFFVIQFKNKLEAVVHTYIVSQLFSGEERAEMLDVFQSLDKNNNGIIEVN